MSNGPKTLPEHSVSEYLDFEREQLPGRKTPIVNVRSKSSGTRSCGGKASEPGARAGVLVLAVAS